jgi:hypothetical protein
MQYVTGGEVPDQVLSKGLEAVTYLTVELAGASIESPLG